MERLMKPFRLRSSKDRKPLSEEQKRKRAGFVVYPLMFLLCLGSFYLIFSPSGQERERQDKGQGFNTEIPSINFLVHSLCTMITVAYGITKNLIRSESIMMP